MLTFSNTIHIAGREIGSDTAPLVIAEISGNHGGQLSQALALIDQCAAAGVEMIKFQTYEADTITLDSDAPEFIVKNKLWKDRKLFDLYKEAQTPFDWHQALFDHTRKHGMIPISSPFDHTAVDLLEDLDCPAYKIASCEMVDFDLIKRVAKTGKPIILSTGAASMDEIQASLTLLYDLGVQDVCLLHCISNYPTSAVQANLRTITMLNMLYPSLVLGFSDHTVGLSVPTAAVALGACIVEKHVCLDDDTDSIDSAFSMPISHITQLITACHDSWSALGYSRTDAFDCEADSLRFRRSLYVCKDIKKGEPFTPDHVRSVRPTGGMHTKHLDTVIGQIAAHDISAASPLSETMIADWQATKNILITSASGKIGLVQLFEQAALDLGICVVTADMDPKCPVAKISKHFHSLPADNDPAYKQELLALCLDQNIGMIIPTRDGELMQLAQIQPDLQAIDVQLPLPDAGRLNTCIDKLAFHQHCLDNDLPVAPQLNPDTIDQFPVFVRARSGAGSRQSFKIDTQDDLLAIDGLDDFLIQPYVDANEYSCDILSDLLGVVQHVIVRQRLEVKNGESVKSKIVDRPDLALLAKKCAESLGLLGHSLVQIFDSKDHGPLLIEANARFGGASYLSIQGGLNSPQYLCQMMMGDYTQPLNFHSQISLMYESGASGSVLCMDNLDFDT